MLYLYAITPALNGTLEALRGVDMAPLFHINQEGIAAVVSRVEAPTVAPTPQRLWEHERVVESLMTQYTVVPVRFSTIFSGEEALRRRLAAMGGALACDLERLHDRVELALRVVRTTPAAVRKAQRNGLPCPDLLATERDGRTFEIARRAADVQRETRLRREESLGEMLHRALARHAVEHQAHVRGGKGVVLKASYLVQRSHLNDMQKAVAGLYKRHPDLHFLCTGPWPPYHFAPVIEPEPTASL